MGSQTRVNGPATQGRLKTEATANVRNVLQTAALGSTSGAAEHNQPVRARRAPANL